LKKNDYFSNIEDLIKETPAKEMLITALKELIPSKGNRFAFLVSIFLALVFSVIIATSENTIGLCIKTIGIIMNALLAIFGCIFMVYSILLAFLNDNYIKKLSQIDYLGKSSYLKKSTTYYESVLFLYFINICMTGIILLALNCIDSKFSLTSNDLVNTILALIFLFVYFGFSFRVFYELKSTIFNTITLFRNSIAYKLLSFVQEEEEKEKEQVNDCNK
jgi:hypothetical protein